MMTGHGAFIINDFSFYLNKPDYSPEDKMSNMSTITGTIKNSSSQRNQKRKYFSILKIEGFAFGIVVFKKVRQ